MVSRAAAAVDAIKQQAGLECQVVTGGGSGTYRVEAASGVYTEVQPGTHPWFVVCCGLLLQQPECVCLRQQTCCGLRRLLCLVQLWMPLGSRGWSVSEDVMGGGSGTYRAEAVGGGSQCGFTPRCS